LSMMTQPEIARPLRFRAIQYPAFAKASPLSNAESSVNP